MPTADYYFPFMDDPALQAVVAALRGDVRYVGGAVRNALLGLPASDIDLATPTHPSEVMTLLHAGGLKVVPTGLQHGTVTAVSGHRAFEITTLRRDVETDGRHAEVAFTDNWQEDAARRDFTINAMSITPLGELHDYFGGQADLAEGRVRFVGEPEQRITEDYLRILRFFRFTAHYGRVVDEAGLAACRKLVHNLPQLSIERVRTELLKTLIAPDPVPVWKLMQEAGVFAALKLPLNNIAQLNRMVTLARTLNISNDLRRLRAATDEGADVHALAARLRLSRADHSRFTQMSLVPFEDVSLHALNHLAYMRGPDTVLDTLMLTARATPETVQYIQHWMRPAFPLTGRDLIVELNMKPGPQMGELLKKVETWWIHQDFRPDREACLKRLRQIAQDIA